MCLCVYFRQLSDVFLSFWAFLWMTGTWRTTIRPLFPLKSETSASCGWFEISSSSVALCKVVMRVKSGAAFSLCKLKAAVRKASHGLSIDFTCGGIFYPESWL